MNLLFFNFISSRYFYGKDRDLMPAKQQPADLCCDKATLSIASKDSQSHGWVQVWGNWLRRSGWDMLCVQAGRTSRLLELYQNQAGEAGRGTLWSEIGQLRTAGKGKVGYSLALALCLCKDWTLCCCGCWPSTPSEWSSGWRAETRCSALGKTGRTSFQVVRYSQDLILWAQFLYLRSDLEKL